MVDANTFTEREGVIHVALQVNRARCIWRETVSIDVGIDGQIEYVNDKGQATGLMVFVQVKSGASYFKGASATSVPFYPLEKHKLYWERSPLPVVLILHNESSGETYWIDARDALRRGSSMIEVPKTSIFDEKSVREVLASSGPLPEQPMTMSSLATAMIANCSPSADLPLDYMDLFLHGLMNLANSVYFGMDLVYDVAHTKLAYGGSDRGFGLGATEFDFIRDYVLFLTAQDLARVDLDEFNREWNQGLVGSFMAPLTIRGRAFCGFLSEIDESHGIRAVQDKAFHGIEPFEAVRRVPVVEQLKTNLTPSSE